MLTVKIIMLGKDGLDLVNRIAQLAYQAIFFGQASHGLRVHHFMKRSGIRRDTLAH
ncbi:MAG: hypothetical protein HQL37_14310 [Alphaproteobacteria bacterium]|nr:hypothetical protein [Alphaproteobacteria bacterium]